MNTIQEMLASKRTLKKFFSECDFVFLSTLNDQITAALMERKAEHDEQERQLQLREAKRLELLELIKAEGFSPSDFVSQTKPAKRKRKYQYVENGVTRYWSGVGKTPAMIQQAIMEGKSLGDFLIHTDIPTFRIDK
jgi:DNA-binding protein H-NS